MSVVTPGTVAVVVKPATGEAEKCRSVPDIQAPPPPPVAGSMPSVLAGSGRRIGATLRAFHAARSFRRIDANCAKRKSGFVGGGAG